MRARACRPSSSFWPQSLHHCSSPTLAPWRADSTRGELFRFRRHSTLPTPHHLLHTHSSLHRTRMEKEHASMIMLGILLLHHIQTLCMWNSSRSASFSWPDLPILAHLVYINIAIISSSCTSSIPHQLSVTKSHMFFLPPAQTSHQRSPGQTGDPGGHRELEKTLGDAASQVGVVVEGWGLHLLLLQEDHHRGLCNMQNSNERV